MTKTVLQKPRVLHWKSPYEWSHEPWTTAGFNLYGILESTSKSQLSVAQVLGLTAQAFRLNIVKDSIHTAGATLYDYHRVLTAGLNNLGFKCRTLGSPSEVIGASPELGVHSGETFTEALKLIQETLDKGHYVLSFNLTLPEFGIIYGYDDDRRELYVGDVNVSFHHTEEHERLPYDRLGRTFTNVLFVLAITDSVEVTEENALAGAIRMILDHANGKETPFAQCANGLKAYDAWIEAFRKGSVDDAGNSYTTELVHDARRYASQFLKETAANWDGLEQEQVRTLLLDAARCYEHCADFFREMCRMFPFAGQRLSPNDPDNSQKAIELLSRAKTSEEQGLTLLHEISVLFDDKALKD